MKKEIKTVMASLVLLSVSFGVKAQDKVIPANQLPKEIKKYVKTHFPNNEIVQASVDKDLRSQSYDVILKENIKLEFNSKNKIKEIDGISALPKSVIPNKISQYVKTNYPKIAITDWELNDANQEVKLENGISLKFNMAGKFLRFDD